MPLQFCTQLFNIFLFFQSKTKKPNQNNNNKKPKPKQTRATFSPHHLHFCLKSTYFSLVQEADWETSKCSAPPPLAKLACRQWERHPLAHTKSTASSRSHGTAAQLWHCRDHCKHWKSLSCLLQAWCWDCICVRLAKPSRHRARPRPTKKGLSSAGASAGR